MPYIPRGETWPRCAGCGRRLSFICQADVRAAGLEKELHIGFFQFYFCWKCHPWEGNESTHGQWLIRTFDRVDEAHAASAAELDGVGKSAPEHAVTFERHDSLPDWETIADIAPEAADLAEEENEDEPWEAYQSAVEAIIGAGRDHSALAGWPAWIQSNAAPEGYRLLAMVDSEGGIMWGDSGVAYLFVSEADPSKFTLEIQCC